MVPWPLGPVREETPVLMYSTLLRALPFLLHLTPFVSLVGGLSQLLSPLCPPRPLYSISTPMSRERVWM